MNYIGLLAQEEVSDLCGSIITGKDFKELFKKNEQQFSKILKGFRAKTLSEDRALSIAVTNINTPSLSSQVNYKIGIWINQIRDNIEKLISEGTTPDIALASTMVDSVFADHVDLYLKLAQEKLDDESRNKLRENMDSIKSERIISAEVDRRVNAITEENKSLVAQIEAAQQHADLVQAGYEQKIQAIEQERKALKASLDDAQEKIAELEAIPSNVRRDHADYLALFDDTDISVLPPANSDEVVSLCCVRKDYTGKKYLFRYADLGHDGRYKLFRKIEVLAPYFKNRDKLFCMDGPSEEGFYGIWNWSVTTNIKDASKDFVISRYSAIPDAIEVVILPGVKCLDDLISTLKRGIEYQSRSGKVMFAFHSLNWKYIGILCNANELKVDSGRTTFDENRVEIPVYRFSNNYILRLDNGLQFYKYAFAGPPIGTYQIKSNHEIIKDIVFSSISWTIYKERALTHAEYRAFKDFLAVIPTEDILSKIETECHCANTAAKTLLNEFLAAAQKYVDGDSVEDKIILSAIYASADLQEKTKSLIFADWEAENKDMLDKAQQKLISIDNTLNVATAQLAEAKEALERTQMEEKRLSNIIEEKEKLAEDVEKSVAERIQKARENAADFIANMAFCSTQSTGAKTLTELNNCDYRVFAQPEDLKELEAHHTWMNVVHTAAEELEAAGVERFSNGVAAFLCAAYIEKQPILLVGPNANDIARAFNAALGCKYGLLCCEGSFDSKAVAEIGREKEEIVIVNNLISSSWINRLPEVLCQKDVFYIVTHPYAEDIQVEPKSLYGFLLPLFTEFFVGKKATGKYFGGYFADDFKHYSPQNAKRKELKYISELALSPLTKNQINSLITTMHDIYSGATADDDFLFAVLPIAYALLAIHDLVEAMNDPQKGISISASLKRDLRYILGDI